MQKRHVQGAFFACLAFMITLTSVACYGQEPAPNKPAAPEQPVAAQGTAGDDQAVDAKFRHDNKNYSVKVVSAEGSALELSVVPKGVFHINLEYPWKFKGADKTYKKDAFSLAESRAALALPESSADGELRFSICNEQTCLIEKVQVATTSP